MPSLRRRIGAGLTVLYERSGFETRRALAEAAGLSSGTVSKLLAGDTASLESVEAVLTAMEGDLHDLAEAVSEAAGEYPRAPSPVSHIAELDYAPRPIDLYQDARRLLREAQRIGQESPSQEAERAVRSLEHTVAQLGDLFDRHDRETARQILEVEDRDLSDEEFDDAMRLLRSLLRRAIAEEQGERRRAGGVSAAEQAVRPEEDGE